ncbi:hypothetical protein R6Z07F_008885 [Ovis aries]
MSLFFLPVLQHHRSLLCPRQWQPRSQADGKPPSAAGRPSTLGDWKLLSKCCSRNASRHGLLRMEDGRREDLNGPARAGLSSRTHLPPPFQAPVDAAVAAAAFRADPGLGTGFHWRPSLSPAAFTEDESLRCRAPTPRRPLAYFHLATGHPCNYGYLKGSHSVEGEFPSSLPLGA